MQGARRTEYTVYFNFFIVSLWKKVSMQSMGVSEPIDTDGNVT